MTSLSWNPFVQKHHTRVTGKPLLWWNTKHLHNVVHTMESLCIMSDFHFLSTQMKSCCLFNKLAKTHFSLLCHFPPQSQNKSPQRRMCWNHKKTLAFGFRSKPHKKQLDLLVERSPNGSFVKELMIEWIAPSKQKAVPVLLLSHNKVY